jgi:SAM-dependent methyltransferase
MTGDARTRRAGGPDAIRARLRGQWESVASGWAAHADHLDARGEEVAERMIAVSGLAPGDHVLELACGPGGVGLAAARRVAPWTVVMSDIAAGVTAIAAERAELLGLGNVEVRERDLERIEEPDATFDVVLCREGLMLVPEPARAAQELHRVLRPGGRLALTVWGRGPAIRGSAWSSMRSASSWACRSPPPGRPGPSLWGRSPDGSRPCSRTPALPDRASPRSRFLCTSAPSRSGGPGRWPSQAHSLRVWSRCRAPRAARSSSAFARPSPPTGPEPV